MRRQRGRVWLMAAALVGFMASGVAAEVVTERSASILVFPKVVADGTRDTIIQITNTSNSMVHAHCFYVNGALTFPDQPAGPSNPPLWTEIDFDIWLTKQQPTYWLVSEGRLVDQDDEPCRPSDLDCNNAGIDPGRVPPVVEDFTGELKCVEVDASGSPVSGNHLKGEATIVTMTENGIGFSVAKYNALGVLGNENNNGDGILCLGGEGSEECPNGAEYNACPQTWIVNHLADGADNPVAGDDTNDVETTITVVPCSQNFETQVPATATIQFAITNEFEQTFSASTSVTCWAELVLSDINEVFSRDFVGTDFVQTRMRPAAGTPQRPPVGFMVVVDESHIVDGIQSTAAANVHVEGERSTADIIVIPADQVGSGN